MRLQSRRARKRRAVPLARAGGQLDEILRLARFAKTFHRLGDTGAIVTVETRAGEPVALELRDATRHEEIRAPDGPGLQADAGGQRFRNDFRQVLPRLALDAFDLELQWMRVCAHRPALPVGRAFYDLR